MKHLGIGLADTQVDGVESSFEKRSKSHFVNVGIAIGQSHHGELGI